MSRIRYLVLTSAEARSSREALPSTLVTITLSFYLTTGKY